MHQQNLPMSLFARLIRDSITVEYLKVGSDGSIAGVNSTFARLHGSALDRLLGVSIDGLMVAPDAEQVRSWLSAEQAPATPVLLNFVTPQSAPYTRRCIAEWAADELHILAEPDFTADALVAEEVLAINNELATLSREHARRGKELEAAHQQLRKTMDELEETHWHLRKIQEVIPSCMACGNIKTDEHVWQSVSDYLLENKIFLSHGYCPACTERILAEMEK